MRNKISHLFVDIGGVLLTNGWDHNARIRAASEFNLDYPGLEKRHQSMVDAFELGRLSLEDYLDRVIFNEKRSFSVERFRRFMFDQSSSYPDMIQLISALKSRFGLKIAAVSNESRELNEYRIQMFQLDAFVDSFISSCYVHIRKPDPEIYRLALDVTHAESSQVIYIENTAEFVGIAQGMGIRSILHRDYESTRDQLADLL